MPFDLHYFAKICPDGDPAAALRWLGRQPLPVILEAFRLQTDLLRQASSRKEKPPSEKFSEFVLAKLLAAIGKIKGTEEALHRKAALDPEVTRKIQELRIAGARVKSPRKGRPKKETVLRVRFGALIDTLRSEGLGWRQIADYLSRYHRFKVSFAYLQRCASRQRNPGEAKLDDQS
jgi:hypothetical protein